MRVSGPGPGLTLELVYQYVYDQLKKLDWKASQPVSTTANRGRTYVEFIVARLGH